MLLDIYVNCIKDIFDLLSLIRITYLINYVYPHLVCESPQAATHEPLLIDSTTYKYL